jgi:hypothetical protein
MTPVLRRTAASGSTDLLRAPFCVCRGFIGRYWKPSDTGRATTVCLTRAHHETESGRGDE